MHLACGTAHSCAKAKSGGDSNIKTLVSKNGQTVTYANAALAAAGAILIAQRTDNLVVGIRSWERRSEV